MATARTCAGCGYHPEPGERLSRTSRLCDLCIVERAVRQMLGRHEGRDPHCIPGTPEWHKMHDPQIA